MAHLVLPNGKGHGWKPQTPDHRDRLFSAHKPLMAITHDVTLKDECMPDVRDQGNWGSCTGHGSTGALMYKLAEKGKPGIQLSRRMAYFEGRKSEAAISDDSGCEIRDVIKVLSKTGVCLESMFPYCPSAPDNASVAVVRKYWTPMTKAPPAAALKNALDHQVKIGFYLCKTVDDILNAINQGLPVVGGWSCFANLDDGQLGHIPMPGPKDNLDGGHCTWFTKGLYHDRYFKFQNSWTAEWGDKGYGYLPFDFVTKSLADDFWAIDHE